MTDRPEKVEIFSNSKCYMNESLLAAINLSNNGNKNWKSFVTAILVQIFGNYLTFMSVKGTRGNIAINDNIFKAIFSEYNKKL